MAFVAGVGCTIGTVARMEASDDMAGRVAGADMDAGSRFGRLPSVEKRGMVAMETEAGELLASYPGSRRGWRGRRKESLVCIACACARFVKYGQYNASVIGKHLLHHTPLIMLAGKERDL